MNKQPRRRFTDDFKAQAVTLSDSVGRTTAARQLGMSAKTLANWVAAGRAGQPLTSTKRQTSTFWASDSPGRPIRAIEFAFQVITTVKAVALTG